MKNQKGRKSFYSYGPTACGKLAYAILLYQVVQVSERTVLEQKAYMLFYVRDRSNVVPRKPLNLSQKENIKTIEYGIKTPAANNQPLKRPVQNGSTEVKPNGLASSVSLAQKDTSDVGPPRIPLSNGTLKRPVQNGTTEVKPNVVAPSVSVAKKDASDVGPPRITLSNGTLDQPKSEPSSTTSLLKNQSEKPLLPAKNPGQCLKTSVPQSNKDDACKLKSCSATIAAASTKDLNEKGSLTKKLCVSFVTSPNLVEIQSPAPAENIATDKTCPEVSRCSLLWSSYYPPFFRYLVFNFIFLAFYFLFFKLEGSCFTRG